MLQTFQAVSGQPQEPYMSLLAHCTRPARLLSSRLVTHSYFKLSLVRGSHTRRGVKAPSCRRFPSSHRGGFPNLMCIFHNVQKGQKRKKIQQGPQTRALKSSQDKTSRCTAGGKKKKKLNHLKTIFARNLARFVVMEKVLGH